MSLQFDDDETPSRNLRDAARDLLAGNVNVAAAVAVLASFLLLGLTVAALVG